MSGEFAASEWRVAVLTVGLVSIFAVSAVLHALHSLFHLPYGDLQKPTFKDI